MLRNILQRFRGQVEEELPETYENVFEILYDNETESATIRFKEGPVYATRIIEPVTDIRFIKEQHLMGFWGSRKGFSLECMPAATVRVVMPTLFVE